MKIRRLLGKEFTAADVYASIPFKVTSSTIRETDGTVVFEIDAFEAPAAWSQIACDVLAQKYFRRSGVPSITMRVEEEGVPDWLWRSVPDAEALMEFEEDLRFSGEVSAKQVFDRLVGAWTYWGWKGGYFESETDACSFFDELRIILARQMAAPASSQWISTGLHWAYGIEEPKQGCFFVDVDSELKTSSATRYERPIAYSCILQSLADDLLSDGGIMDLWVREARVFKHGAGTGSNFSNLRGKGEKSSCGGTSSGLMTFLEVGDRNAGAVKSDVGKRRAAKMVGVDVDHPEIETFIDWKVLEEQKVSSLVAGSKVHVQKLSAIADAILTWDGALSEAVDPSVNQGLEVAVKDAQASMIPDGYLRKVLNYFKQGYRSIEFDTFDAYGDSGAYATVSGQNSKSIVCVSNAFLDAVAKKEPWELVRRTDGKSEKTVQAEGLWNNLAHAAWACADPGIVFSDTVEDWNTCRMSGSINACSPCAEFFFLDDTTCCFATLNLRKFLIDGVIDLESYQHAIELFTIVLEISISMGQYPTIESARNSHDFRPIGLGFANLSSLLMAIGLGYDSDEARNACAGFAAVLTATAYLTSAKMAKELGPFKCYSENSEDMLRVIRNHRRAAEGARDGYESFGAPLEPLNSKHCGHANLVEAAVRTWEEAVSLGELYGFRNAQASVIAPVGTIGLVMDCETSGIDPDFASIKFQKNDSGRYYKTVGRPAMMALEQLGYSNDQIEDILDYIFGRPSLEDAPIINRVSLKKKGFDDLQIEAVEKQLTNTIDIQFIFTSFTLGEDFCLNHLGVDAKLLDDPNFNLLSHIGFTDSEIQITNDFLLGTMTFEGAPHVQERHLPVFDLSNRAGRMGRRCLSAESQLKMMAAAQPFISGGVSKPIVLPNNATVEDCASVHLLANRLGLKYISIYREGSKLSDLSPW